MGGFVRCVVNDSGFREGKGRKGERARGQGVNRDNDGFFVGQGRRPDGPCGGNPGGWVFGDESWRVGIGAEHRLLLVDLAAWAVEGVTPDLRFQKILDFGDDLGVGVFEDVVAGVGGGR